jgi:DNA polymerase III epsilon subunit-like protein
MSKILVLDSETTGLAGTDQVIELYYKEIAQDFMSIPDSFFHKRYKPSVMININAFKVHGIGMAELIKCDKSSTVTIPEDTSYLIGSNISFDVRLLKQSNPNLILDNIKLIDTKEITALINSIDKNNKVFADTKLATLYKHFFPLSKLNDNPYHSAQDDVVKTHAVLQKLLTYLPALDSIDKVYAFIQSTKNMKL